MLTEIEKVLDCWSICAPALAQQLALYGIQHEQAWLDQCRHTMQQRLSQIRTLFEALEGIKLRSSGAYFAWLELERSGRGHDSHAISQHWISQLGVLAIPGNQFAATGPELRLAFANLDHQGIEQLGQRLTQGPLTPA